MIIQKYPFIILETKNTSLVFEIKDYLDERTPFNKNKKFITQKHFGKKCSYENLELSKMGICPHGSCDDYNFDNLISSYFGNGNNEEPSIILDNCDNTYTNRFFYKEHLVIDGGVDIIGPHSRDVSETLDIIEYDDVLKIELHHYYSIFYDSDIIVSKKRIINFNEENLIVKRLLSLECPISSNKVKVYTFDGAWIYERSRHETVLTNGIYINDSKAGSSSHKHNPFFEVCDEVNGGYYGFNLIYSGNHKGIVEVNSLNHSSVMIGMNDYLFETKLSKNNEFITPEAIMVYAESLDQITSEMHDFVLNHIIDPKYKNMTRPIIFNNWEGTGMNINETALFEMAEIAKRVGVELFVMDDGWFKNRKTDLGGLGDWTVDKDKFPNGLGNFVKKVKNLGLKFGIWVEPEMICINSDLYKEHPEFALKVPNREPIERRHQLIIDMANPKVQDYLFDSLCKVFDEVEPDYIKWDYNRNISDMYSTAVSKGEYFHKFINGTYSLIERLIKRYPNMLLESCSSGGGRFDLGILYYMPQTWGSDDTNTYYRSFITCGTLTAYPQSCFGAHVSRDGSPSPIKGNGVASLEDRFNLHCIGAFGYEFDFRTFNEQELDIMKKQIEFYKEYRNVLQYGKFYINSNCFDDKRYFSFNTVNENKELSLLYISELDKDVPNKMWTAKGLNPDFKYRVKVRNQYNLNSDTILGEFTGLEIMNVGITTGPLSNTLDSEIYDSGIFTRLLILERIG